MFVRRADEAAARPASATRRRRSGYLDHAALERALRAARADAAWVGWGFVAEQPEFAELCERLGIVFVGPEPTVMRRVGDKIAAKRLAEEAGVPVAPWSGGPVASRRRGAATTRSGSAFPLMIKAAAGGGGRGHPPGRRRPRRCPPRSPARGPRRCRRSATARCCWRSSSRRRATSRCRSSPTATAPPGRSGVRDCSYQRRNQKVIEESASPALTRRAGARDHGGGAPPGAARRLPQRRHGRVPLRAGRRGASRSWRSTRACRSSTPSPRRSPAWTS